MSSDTPGGRNMLLAVLTWCRPVGVDALATHGKAATSGMSRRWKLVSSTSSSSPRSSTALACEKETGCDDVSASNSTPTEAAGDALRRRLVGRSGSGLCGVLASADSWSTGSSRRTALPLPLFPAVGTGTAVRERDDARWLRAGSLDTDTL